MGRPLKSVFKKEHRDDITNRSANPVFSEVAEVFLSRRRFLQMGAVAGAEVSRRRQGNQQSEQGRQTVELLIKTEAGKLLNVVQEQDPALTFAKGDRVRILTTGADTRVDKSV